MDVMIARVLVALVGLAVIVGAVLFVISFFMPALRFRRPRRPQDKIDFSP